MGRRVDRVVGVARAARIGWPVGVTLADSSDEGARAVALVGVAATRDGGGHGRVGWQS